MILYIADSSTSTGSSLLIDTMIDVIDSIDDIDISTVYHDLPRTSRIATT